MYRLSYNGDVAAGQLAVFQGASEAPISELIRAEPVRQPPDRLRIHSDMRPPRALPAAHFERNGVTII
jgi:hypothetical protein